MKIAALLIASLLLTRTADAKDVTIKELLAKDRLPIAGDQLLMITVDYAPGASDPVHRHRAQAMVYVLEGSVVMQVQGKPAVTLKQGETFYEGPDDIHMVARNASQTARAKFLVFFVKPKGADLKLGVE